MTAAAPLLSLDELKAVWYELHISRSAIHRRYHLGPCDTELTMSGVRFGSRRDSEPAPPAGYRLTGECPCRDLVADAIEIVLSYLTDHGETLANPPGAVRTHLRYRMRDHNRSARAELGAQSRPERVANNRYGRALRDDFHRSLFVMVTEEAGVRGPLGGSEGLMRRGGGGGAGPPRRAAHGRDAGRRVPEALQVIERTCRGGPRVNVGTRADPKLVTWWEAYIERPLGRRASLEEAGAPQLDDIPDPMASHAFDHVLSAVAAGLDVSGEPDEHIVLHTLCSTVGSAGDRADTELRRALAALGERGLLPGPRVRSLLADTRQREQVITYVHLVNSQGMR